MRFSLLISMAIPIALAGVTVSAQAPLLTTLGGERGFGESCLHRNDDQSSRSIDLTPAFPGGLRFFDRTHTTAFVNTNGNLTFSRGLGTFTPRPFPVANQPMIAPFWADIDTRHAPSDETGCTTESSGTCSGGDNSVWWHLEPGRMIVTWHDARYFTAFCDSLDRRVNLQLILTAVPSCGGGATDFDVEFRYDRCEWETGNASDGTNGFGGTPAQAGFDAGNSRDFVAIMGSRTAGIASRLCTMSNVGDPGVWQFQIRSGAVLCPEAGDACSTGRPGVCGEGVTQCVGEGTECVAVVDASDERCDGLDNDCDGSVDEGEEICGVATNSICERGTCVDVCFEGGCAEGLICNEANRCVEASCEDLECPEGQRCRGGACVDACDGIVCPAGLSCRAGRCFDLCADLSCDPECTTCFDGACIARCDLPATGCEAGQTCTGDGLCVPTGCVGVDCGPGQVCTATGCVDACEGAVCPAGERCELGMCVSDRLEDMDEDPDLGEGDAGAEEEADAGVVDAGRTPGGRRDAGDGCGCVTPGAAPSTPMLPLALGALGALVLVTRRRRR